MTDRSVIIKTQKKSTLPHACQPLGADRLTPYRRVAGVLGLLNALLADLLAQRDAKRLVQRSRVLFEAALLAEID